MESESERDELPAIASSSSAGGLVWIVIVVAVVAVLWYLNRRGVRAPGLAAAPPIVSAWNPLE